MNDPMPKSVMVVSVAICAATLLITIGIYSDPYGSYPDSFDSGSGSPMPYGYGSSSSSSTTSSSSSSSSSGEPEPITGCLADFDGNGVIELGKEGEYQFVTPSECKAVNGSVACSNDALARLADRFSGSSSATVVANIAPHHFTAVGPLKLRKGGLTPAEKLAIDDTKIPQRTYVPEKYDCDDFARDMETMLEALGFDVSIDLIKTWTFDHGIGELLDSEMKPYSTVTTEGLRVSLHVINDLNKGEIHFEPQTGKEVELDLNDDGELEVADEYDGEENDEDGEPEPIENNGTAHLNSEKEGVGLVNSVRIWSFDSFQDFSDWMKTQEGIKMDK